MIINRKSLVNLIQREISNVLVENYDFMDYFPRPGSSDDDYVDKIIAAAEELVNVFDPDFYKILQGSYSVRNSYDEDDFYQNLPYYDKISDKEYGDMVDRGSPPLMSLDNAAQAGQEYTIKKGDNLTKIAKKFSIDLKTLLYYNKSRIKNKDLIYPGDVIYIPPPDLPDQGRVYGLRSGQIADGEDAITIYSNIILQSRNQYVKSLKVSMLRKKKIGNWSDQKTNLETLKVLKEIFVLLAVQTAGTLVHEAYHLTDELDVDSDFSVFGPGEEEIYRQDFYQNQIEARAFQYEGKFFEKILNSNLLSKFKRAKKKIISLKNNAKERKITWQYHLNKEN